MSSLKLGGRRLVVVIPLVLGIGALAVVGDLPHSMVGESSTAAALSTTKASRSVTKAKSTSKWRSTEARWWLCGARSAPSLDPAAGRGVESYAPKPFTPTRVVSVQPGDPLPTAMAQLRPGDLVEFEPGEYSGWAEIVAAATPEAPIVLRPRIPGTAIFSGETSLQLNGSHATVEGFIFRTTSWRNLVVRGAGNVIAGNRWENSGSGLNDESGGLIWFPNDESVWDASGFLGVGAPTRELNTVIEYNSFTSPANTPIWINHGVRGTTVRYNSFVGPHRMVENGQPAFFASVIKVGYGFGNDSSNTLVYRNNVTGWGRSVYLIGVKGSDVEIRENVFTEGRVVVRGGDRVKIIDNVFGDGSIALTGNDHVVDGNVVVLNQSVDPEGALVLSYASTRQVGDYNFDGTSLPYFYRDAVGAKVTANLFVSLGVRPVVTFVQNPVSVSDHPPRNNVLQSNTLVGSTTYGAEVLGILNSLNSVQRAAVLRQSGGLSRWSTISTAAKRTVCV